MIAEAATVQRLADRFKRRGVRRLVYFHCDHFEPWSHFEDRAANDPRHVENVLTFGEDCATLPYARALTLFYLPLQSFLLDPKRDLLRADPADAIGFIPRTGKESELGRSAMRGLLERVGHEIQLHMHHEGFTSNTSHRQRDRIDYLATPEGRAGDGPRLSLALSLCKDAIREETGLSFEEWFFVHGLWALQGSDPTVCNIADELQRLTDAGCRGDFTFPAGRRHVNPRHEVPYFCYPITELRGYDLDRSEPETAYGNGAAARRKFFVWASGIKHTRSSLDYSSAAVLQSLETPQAWVSDIADMAYAVHGTLYFKTHAHSMNPLYRLGGRRLLPPHAHPRVRDLFGLLIETAIAAGCGVDFLKASEVYHEFTFASDISPDGAALFDVSILPPGPNPVLTKPIAAQPWLAELHTALKAAPTLAPPPALEDLAATVNEAAVRVMRERIARMGETESGAYQYYAAATAKGELLPTALVSVARRIRELDHFEEYHEVGAGLGVLSALLAAAGCQVLAIENDGRRSAASGAIHEELAGLFSKLPSALNRLTGRFPNVLGERDVTGCLAVFVNFIGTIDREAVMSGMRRYRACLVDIDRFGTQLSDDAARGERLESFRDAGFLDKGCVLVLPGGQGRFHLLAADAVECVDSTTAS